MADYYGKLKDRENGRKRKKLWKIFLIGFLLIVFWFMAAVLIGIFSDNEQYGKIRELMAENSQLEDRIYELAEENKALKRQIENINE